MPHKIKDQINEIAFGSNPPNTIGEFNALKQLDDLGLFLQFPFPVARLQQEIIQNVSRQFSNIIDMQIISKIDHHMVQPGVAVLPSIKNVIAVASGKGGVGKSTTTANLALAMQQAGAKVGVLDADIYGPSIPKLFNLSGKPALNGQDQMIAHEQYGVKVNSIGFLIDEQAPAAWRGPMVSQALQQLFFQTDWGQLDYLFIDMPPGTGDIQLTLAQKIPVTAAVIVTTPQDLALIDAQKALVMFQKSSIPVIGLIENMSIHVCSQCGHQEAIFGALGVQKMAEQFQTTLLGSLPLEMSIRKMADAGKPTVVGDPYSDATQLYLEIAHRTACSIAKLPKDLSHKISIVKE